MRVAGLKKSRSIIGIVLIALALCAVLVAALWVGDLLVVVVRLLYSLVFAVHDIVRAVLGTS